MQKTRTTLLLEKGLSLQARGRIKEAEEIYKGVLEKNPRNPHALHYLGQAAQQSGRTEEAIQLMAKSLEGDPKNVHALTTLAGLLKDQRSFDRAALFYQAALALDPRDAAAHSNLGVVLGELGRLDEAIACHEQAIKLNPKMCAAYCNLGAIFHLRRNFNGALDCFKKALALNPRAHQVSANIAAVLVDTGKYSEALPHCDAALKIEPRWELAHTNRAAALHKLGRSVEAMNSCQQALAINPFSHAALNNLGNAFREEGHLEQAAECLRKALALKPDQAKIHENLGVTLRDMGLIGEALACLQKAVELDPTDPDMQRSLGGFYYITGRAREALACFRKTIELKPDFAEAYSDLLLTLNYLPHNPEELFAEHVRFGKVCCEPFEKIARPHRNKADVHRRLRVGYLSGDLREHPVAIFMEPVFASYSRSEFEVFCYANYRTNDLVSERLRGLVDNWSNVDKLSDDELADTIREDGIDILVDLSGHTALNRLLVMARKPAPVQVTMVGYMQTTGMTAIDYRITDEILDPVGTSEHLSTEELVRLPAGALSFRMPKDSPPVNDLPALKDGHVTFASFNNLAKVTSEVIATWAEVMRAVPGSRLVIVAPGENSLAAAFESHGIAASRIEIVKRLPMREYLALHHRADLVLDTFPYNGGTVNFIAAWMGVPFVTMAGTNTISRHGARALATVGLSELIAKDCAEYVLKAVDAVRDLQRLAGWRRSLRPRLEACANDGSSFTRQLEQAYRGMWRRWCEEQALVDVEAEEALCLA